MEITDMKQIDKIEEYFFQARRSAFIISFLCFIGTGISLTALTALDPALGIIIPILALIVITLFTLFFLLLAFRLFQPIREIVKMVDKLYTDVMRDEMDVEPVGAETEREKLAELTQQIRSLKKEIAVLKKEEVSSEKEQVSSVREYDRFWPVLILKWLFFVAVVLAVMSVIPNPLGVFFPVVGVVGITIIALAHARNKGRLRWPRGDEK